MTPTLTDIRLGIARGISYGLFGPFEPFVATARALGAGLVRLYVYWSQVEPRPGLYNWSIVDALMSQLSGDEEVWVTVCASSQWGTRTPTDFLPPSPATSLEAYQAFVRALVARCRGRVHYWQCENEPSNVGLLWAGTAAEYVDQLAVFARAVRDSDPRAAVVLGGCGYDVLSSPPDGPPRVFFGEVLSRGQGAFDLFDVHLYDSPELIPAHLATVRAMMREHGDERPVVVGEYNGPTLFEFPELDGVVQQTMADAFAADEDASLSTTALSATATVETPERRALKLLYERMESLPPALQMFMKGCPSALDELRDRINCRQIVTRNLLALAEGVPRTVCWQLAPEVGNYEDPFTMMELMHGKLPLMVYENETLGRRRPPADAFARLATQLRGAQSVTPIGADPGGGVRAYRAIGPDHGPVTVLWKDGDLIDGEREPPTRVQLDWREPTISAADALGVPVPVSVDGGKVALEVPVTPVFLSTRSPSRAASRDPHDGSPRSARTPRSSRAPSPL